MTMCARLWAVRRQFVVVNVPHALPLRHPVLAP